MLNPLIVETLERFGGKALGLSGRSVIQARKLSLPATPKSKPLDLGLVGDVVGIHPQPILDALARGAVPVISPLGTDDSGTVLNVNADVAAGAIAAELQAYKLIYISDVRGIMRDPTQEDSLIPAVNSELIARLIKDEIIEGGMIPKAESAVAALGRGVAKAHLVDGRASHSLLLEFFTNMGIGTEILP